MSSMVPGGHSLEEQSNPGLQSIGIHSKTFPPRDYSPAGHTTQSVADDGFKLALFPYGHVITGIHALIFLPLDH